MRAAATSAAVALYVAGTSEWPSRSWNACSSGSSTVSKSGRLRPFGVTQLPPLLLLMMMLLLLLLLLLLGLTAAPRGFARNTAPSRTIRCSPTPCRGSWTRSWTGGIEGADCVVESAR